MSSGDLTDSLAIDTQKSLGTLDCQAALDLAFMSLAGNTDLLSSAIGTAKKKH